MKIVEPSVEVYFHVPHTLGGGSIEPKVFLELVGRTCYTKNVEVLTSLGWKKVSEVRKLQVLTYNKKTNTIEYQESNMISKRYKGSILYSSHRELVFEVTPDHRMVAAKAYTGKRDYDFLMASNLRIGKKENPSYRLPKFFIDNTLKTSEYEGIEFGYVCKVKHGWRPDTAESFTLPICDDTLILLAAYITEGHIRSTAGTGAGIIITQTVGTPLYNRLIKSLNNLKLSYRIDNDPRKEAIHFIHINGGQPCAKFFESECGRGSHNKHLPGFFRSLSRRQILLLLEVLYEGDGSHSTTRQQQYLTVSEQLADEVQELHVLAGISASKHWERTNEIWVVEENKRDSWILYQEDIHEKEYDDTVYCPSTTNGIVCIRIDGKVMWCGNCYKSEDRITAKSAPMFIKMLYDRGHHAMLEHCVASVKFICDRGVTHELVRHRIASFAQESSRFCDYHKDKFDGQIAVIEPPGLSQEQRDWWMAACEQAEKSYMQMRKLGVAPQIARAVLPTCLKTEIWATANLREWEHICKLRCSPQAHPQMRDIMCKVDKIFVETIPEIFGSGEVTCQ